MANVKRQVNLRKELKEHFCDYNLKLEQTYLGSDWWYVSTLIAYIKENYVVEIDLDLASIDLSVMPWECKSVLQFIQHTIDIQSVDFKYPVILSPGGWIMNGWHRVVKGILEGKQTIKAVRIFKLPPCDGTTATKETKGE